MARTIYPLPLDAPDDVAFDWLDHLIDGTNESLKGSDAPPQNREWLLKLLLPAYGPIMYLSRLGGDHSRLIAAWESFGLWWRDTYLARHPDLALQHAMSELSERRIFATWDIGNEFVIWGKLQGIRDAATSDDPEVPALLEKVRRLSNETGIWWVWSKADRALVKVPLDEWKWIYARKKSAQHML